MRKKDALDICLRNILSYTDRNNPEKKNQQSKKACNSGRDGVSDSPPGVNSAGGGSVLK